MNSFSASSMAGRAAAAGSRPGAASRCALALLGGVDARRPRARSRSCASRRRWARRTRSRSGRACAGRRRSGRRGRPRRWRRAPALSSSTTIGCRNSPIICSISASTISFSNEATSPPSIQPAPCMHHVGVAHDRAPDRHLRLVGGLGIHRVGGAGVGGAVGQLVAPGELAAGEAARVYSGVPKAGAPVFMSTFEVKPPYMHGRARRARSGSR